MKVGLFFGSFNPIHVGHLLIANYMASFTELNQVWFVVSPQNPLKDKKSLLNQYHRLQMVQLAIEGSELYKASDVEFKLPLPSYTSHTLVYLQEKHPQHEFALILGADNLANLHKWKNHEQLLANHQLYVYPRPGVEPGPLSSHPHVHLVDAPIVEISSTFIREAIRNKKDIQHFLPSLVYKELIDMHFYEK